MEKTQHPKESIEDIIKRQNADLFLRRPGIVADTFDHRDHDAEELLAGVDIKIPSFEEGYSAIKKWWPDMPYTNQSGQFSCVGRANALYKQILQAKDTGEKTILSAKSIYNPIAIPGVGSSLRSGALRTVDYGVNKESSVPSGGAEEDITAPFNFEPFKEEAAFYKNREVASVKTQDFTKLARLIFLNEGIVSGWGSHAVYFAEYGILNGKRYLKTPNSYGEGNDLYYFENSGQEPLFSAWTAIDLKVLPVTSDALFSNLKYGDKGEQVLKLKNALIKLGWVEARKVVLKPGNEYDDNLAWIVMNFKLGRVHTNIWDRSWEQFYFRGREVDTKTREIINNDLANKYGN